jgi:ribosomal protein S18 acetylase RimI-like enzyme
MRPARSDDREAVMAISATVWDGHDYLPRVWDHWVSEPIAEGFLLAADVDGVVVGIQHTAIQSHGVAWIEGIRVHPDYRNRGIAAQMLTFAIDQSKRLGLRVVRLSTAHVNEISSRLALGHGLVQVARFDIYSAEALTSNIGSEDTSVSTEDILQLRQRLNRKGTLIVHQWSAYDLPGQKSPIDFPIHLVTREAGEISGIGLAATSRDGMELTIAYIDGDSASVKTLAHDFRALASREGYGRVSGMLSQDPEVSQGMSAAGYELNDELQALVFEGPLN